jgi:hypothetical protein
MNDRLENAAVKIRTQFGVLHLHLDYDDNLRPQRVSYRANDDKVTPDTQIGQFLGHVLDGINKAIADANADWSAKWDIAAIAKRRAVSEQTQQMIEEARAL